MKGAVWLPSLNIRTYADSQGLLVTAEAGQGIYKIFARISQSTDQKSSIRYPLLPFESSMDAPFCVSFEVVNGISTGTLFRFFTKLIHWQPELECRMQVQLLFLSLASAVFGAQPIPGDLLKKLKKSRSLQDFMDVASVQARQGKIRRISIQSSTALMKANTMGASLLSLHSKSSGSAADDDLQSIMSLPQGGDTCTLQNICVRVPFASSDPGVIVYPTCFEVTRCVGSCCDEEESCHATAVEFVERPRVELVYMGNSRFMANQTLNVSVEQHLACGCRDCSLEGPAPQCEPGRVIGPSCDCECGNQLEKASCKGRNRWWNENSCTCGCEIFSCPPESTLNRAICECEQNDVVRIDEPDDNGDFQSDTSKLPRLKYRSRSQ